MKEILHKIFVISHRELRLYSRRPLFLFSIIIAPILCIFFFTTMMNRGLPHKMPAAIVDEDNTHVTRILVRYLGGMEQTKLIPYDDFPAAREAVQRGEVYAIFYIPKGTTEDAEANRQPKISFYTNDSYYVPGNLLMRDMRTMSELAGLALTRETLYQTGKTEDEAMAIIQPIALEVHPLKNPTLNYSVYLSNMLVPGIMILLILLTTTYTLGLEWKQGTQKELYELSGESQTVACIGKLLPQCGMYILLFWLKDVWFFNILGYPCNCGIGVMMAISVLTVLSTEGFGIFLFGLMAGEVRLAMCICSLWGILSFSLAGFTYPVTAMHPILRYMAVFFPLRHYYLIYVNQALYGFSIHYVASSIAVMVAFCFLPFTLHWRYRKAFLKFQYLR